MNGLPPMKSMQDHMSSPEPLHHPSKASTISSDPFQKIRVVPSAHFCFSKAKGWEEKEQTWMPTDRFTNPDLGNGTWKNVDESPLSPTIPLRVIENYNRAHNIETTIQRYQQELKELPATSDRVFLLNHLIPILEKAVSYQNALIARLQEGPKDAKGAKLFLNLHDALKINDRPNAIERIAKQIEEDDEQFKFYQLEHSKIATLLTELEQHPQPHVEKRQRLLMQQQHLDQAMRERRVLMQQRALYAKRLSPPYQELDPSTKAEIENQKWHVLKIETLAQREYLLAQALGIWWEQPTKATYLNNAAVTLSHAAQEAQKPAVLRNQEVFDQFHHAATLCQQAVKAWDESLETKASYINDAGGCFLHLAQEMQNPTEQRNQEAMDFLKQSARLHQEAANTSNQNEGQQASYLNNAGGIFFAAAQEAFKPAPLRNAAAIACFTQAALLCQNASTVAQHQQLVKASYLNHAGNALLHAAQELCKPAMQRNQQAIDYFKRSCSLFQEAAAQWSPTQSQQAPHSNSAGRLFFYAAQEALKPHPDHSFITCLVSEAEKLERNARSSDSCVIN